MHYCSAFNFCGLGITDEGRSSDYAPGTNCTGCDPNWKPEKERRDYEEQQQSTGKPTGDPTAERSEPPSKAEMTLTPTAEAEPPPREPMTLTPTAVPSARPTGRPSDGAETSKEDARATSGRDEKASKAERKHERSPAKEEEGETKGGKAKEGKAKEGSGEMEKKVQDVSEVPPAQCVASPHGWLHALTVD